MCCGSCWQLPPRFQPSRQNQLQVHPTGWRPPKGRPSGTGAIRQFSRNNWQLCVTQLGSCSLCAAVMWCTLAAGMWSWMDVGTSVRRSSCSPSAAHSSGGRSVYVRHTTNTHKAQKTLTKGVRVANMQPIKERRDLFSSLVLIGCFVLDHF